MTAPRFLTLSDVAEELQVSLSQVRALVYCCFYKGIYTCRGVFMGVPTN